VAASRVLNEDDILEAFVRHHAALVDHHIFLDNGSSDRSLAILRALQAEGLPLTVLQTRAAHFCDEFVDQRRTEGGLRAVLASLLRDAGFLLPGTPEMGQVEDPID